MNRLLNAVAVAIVIFVTVIAFVVGSRIDQNTVSLLLGTAIGALVTAPCAVICTVVVMRGRESHGRGQDYGYPAPPPAFYTMPPQQPWPGAAPQGWPQVGYGMQDYLPPPRRRFYVVGEDGEAREMGAGEVGGGI